MRLKSRITIRPSLFLVPLLALAAFTSGAAAPDSTAPARDPFLAPPPPGATLAMPDTLPPMAMQEAVKLSTQGSFTNLSPRVGDSLDYVLQVEWQETQVPVIVLPPDSLAFEGFKILGQATVHKKLAAGQDIRNHTEFIYRLRAQTQGTGRASSLKVRYMTGMSRSEEAVFVPTALVDILPAPVRLTDMLWFKLLGGLILLGGAVALAWFSFRLTLRSRKRPEPAKTDLKPEVAALKQRLRSAASSPDASKEILLAMEGLCIRFLQQETIATGAGNAAQGTASPGPARFDPLADAYLARNGGSGAPDAQDWAKLRELFRHARFAGGHKEPHELQDAFRTFKRCLKITGEDEHE